MIRNDEDRRLLEENDWNILCEYPFEIRHIDGGAVASGIAADIVLDSYRPVKADPRVVLKHLDPDDKRYMAKLHILHTLITRSGANFAIPTDMHEWCESVGFKTTARIVGDSNWWTVEEK